MPTPASTLVTTTNRCGDETLDTAGASARVTSRRVDLSQNRYYSIINILRGLFCKLLIFPRLCCNWYPGTLVSTTLVNVGKPNCTRLVRLYISARNCKWCRSPKIRTSLIIEKSQLLIPFSQKVF